MKNIKYGWSFHTYSLKDNTDFVVGLKTGNWLWKYGTWDFRLKFDQK